MATNDEDERYAKMLISTVNDLAIQLGKVRQEIKEDMAQALIRYREDTHRAIMGVHVRIVSLEDTIETDRAARIARQQILDGELRGIRANQRFWIRLGVLLALVSAGVLLGVWLF